MSPVSFFRRTLALSTALMAISTSAQTALLTYSFTGNTASPTTVDSNLTGSAMSSLVGLTVSNSSPVSSGYTGASGSYYGAGGNGWGSTGNYFELTITPAAGQTVTITTLSFGYKESSTSGPTAFTLKSSADNYGSAIATGSFVTADTNWHATGSTSITLSAFSSATTLRIYATGAANNTPTLKIDDLIISGSTSASAVPEPSTYAALAGACALGGVMWHRRRQRVLALKN
ncbi:MAG: PEP-CTERM sorting domain-containing protein [Candidatus Didemnitutus sp.]|nr:PEP-CTERM sorting domain-containing protein [Candidatus Didemnitutus sp.]